MKTKVFFLLALLLSGCFDATMELDFAEEEVRIEQKMSRQLYDMSGSGDCAGDETLNEAEYTCKDIRAFDVEAALAGDWDASIPSPASAPPSTDRVAPFHLERIGRRNYRFSFDVAGVIAEMEDPTADPEIEPILPMLEAAIAGHGMTILLDGVRVSETNGAISDDGTSVSFVVPLTHLLHPDRGLAPDQYFAEFKIR